MITYTDSLDGVLTEQLQGFFEGWPKPPSPKTHMRILRGSSHFVLAIAPDGQVVGFVTAISDGVLNAFIPLLEVIPTHRHQGIATELVGRLVAQLGDLYAIDLHCEADVVPFYESLGMKPMGGMGLRNYSVQAGRCTDAP